jgi:hypothetical protein
MSAFELARFTQSCQLSNGILSNELLWQYVFLARSAVLLHSTAVESLVLWTDTPALSQDHRLLEHSLGRAM